MVMKNAAGSVMQYVTQYTRAYHGSPSGSETKNGTLSNNHLVIVTYLVIVILFLMLSKIQARSPRPCNASSCTSLFDHGYVITTFFYNKKY